MMTIFTMAVAAVMFSGMVLCMGMFLRARNQLNPGND